MKVPIGGDPEFVLSRDGIYCNPAHEYLSDDGRTRNLNDIVGTDGHSQTGEIRVPPVFTPSEFVGAVHYVLSILNEKIPSNLMVLSGAYKCHKCIGGHIHLSVPIDEPLRTSIPLAAYEVVRHLPFPETEKLNREAGGYGASNDCRFSKRLVEWRYPPSWLISPSVCLSYIALTWGATKVLIEDKGDITIERVIDKVRQCDSLAAAKTIARVIECRDQVDWNSDSLINWGIKREE